MGEDEVFKVIRTGKTRRRFFLVVMVMCSMVVSRESMETHGYQGDICGRGIHKKTSKI